MERPAQTAKDGEFAWVFALGPRGRCHGLGWLVPLSTT
jgi:hypothetical protein